MLPNPVFSGLPKLFWANVRTIGQQVGYTTSRRRSTSGRGEVKVPDLAEIEAAYRRIGLRASHLLGARGRPTKLGQRLHAYFKYRADVLNGHVQHLLMTGAEAKALFDELQRSYGSARTAPMNKQSRDKKQPAYFTGIVNLLIEANAAGHPCNYNPMELTTVTRNAAPLRTLARRVDGAFPGPVNPIAVWEIKEYYYTTTFGSRVADGVYESLLDGMELEELRDREGVDIKHYLMVDARDTWWGLGKSYLCRIIDMLHMRYLDEALFGREVVERLPRIVKEWARAASADRLD